MPLLARENATCERNNEKQSIRCRRHTRNGHRPPAAEITDSAVYVVKKEVHTGTP